MKMLEGNKMEHIWVAVNTLGWSVYEKQWVTVVDHILQANDL